MQDRRNGGSLADLRTANRNAAVGLLRVHGGLTQSELSRLSGLSRASVSNIVRELVDEGQVRLRPVTSNGRRASEVSLAPRPGVVAGVDFGNRHVRVVIAGMSRTVLAEESLALPLGHSADESIDRCIDLIGTLVGRAKHSLDDLAGMAAGIPGPIIAGTSRLGAPTILPGWADVDVAAAFRDALDIPVAVDNDANLGAIGESLFGEGRGVSDFAYLKVSTGIGAGLVLNGRLYRGTVGTAGEIGHTTIDENGALCRCGNRGCLETVAGAPALLALVEASHGQTLELEDLLRLTQDGDIGCCRVVADAGRHIGVAVANLCNLLSPALVVIGGEMAAAGEVLLAPLRDSMSRRAVSVAARATRVVKGALGERTSALGAVGLALQEVEAQR